MKLGELLNPVQSAIESLEYLKIQFKSKPQFFNYTDHDVESLEMAIKALQKQIPKKPILEHLYGFVCPNCDLHYLECKKSCCERCGQKLDWSGR